MKYNFDEILPRRGTHSIKWDAAGSDDILPMWIADMDFKTLPAITRALSGIAAEGHYGYNTVPQTFYDSIISWWQKRHNCSLKKEWILPATGVVSGISAIISLLAKPGDEVIIQTPAYNHFFNVISAYRCKTIVNDLIYEGGSYAIDFVDLELKAASLKAKILLLCNPHNPVGRVWTERELDRIASICARHDVLVISDEIHSDLLFAGHKHLPFTSIALNHDLPALTCSSASKTFNLSGLHAAYIIVNDGDLRRRLEKQLWAHGAATPSLIACEALTISYLEGEEWLKQLNDYLYENYNFLKTFLEAHISCIAVLPLEATYLVWLDCKRVGIKSNELSKLIFENQKLWVNPGDMYGASGEGFLRINIACPRENLKEGLNRLRDFIANSVKHP